MHLGAQARVVRSSCPQLAVDHMFCLDLLGLPTFLLQIAQRPCDVTFDTDANANA